MSSVATAIAIVDRIFFAGAAALSVYLGISTFVFLQQSPRHYATLVFALLVLSGLLALRDVLAEGRTTRGLRFGIRLGLAGFVLVGGTLATAYIGLNADRLQVEQPFLSERDVVVGAVFLLALLVANWFHWGGVLTSVIGVVILYFFLGHLIESPLLLKHPRYEVAFVMSYMGMNTTEGAFAYLADGVEKLYFLVIFAAVLIACGMTGLVTELGKAVGRYVRGGAAFPAIVGSALEGMVMGAAVTNVVMSGKLTIPMMKRHGFRAEFAAAVEVAASTAGQIIPPVMGLAAFIMAAFLNIPYTTVALLAVIPSFLYLVGVTIAVLVKSSADRLPKLSEPFDAAMVWRLLPAFVVPVAIVIVLLLQFYSPSYAGLFGIAATLPLCLFQGRFRPRAADFRRALHEGFEVTIQLCLLLVAIGPLAQTFVTTNLAGRASSLLVHIVPDNALTILVGAMVLTLILGMGLPTPAAYLLVALTLGHFLQQQGVEPIPAHFFIQYFAVFSAVTPPVALASLAGAKIAQASFLGTSIESLKLVAPAFFVPFAFIYHPSLLDFPQVSWSLLAAMAGVILVQWNASVALYGFLVRPLGRVERGVFGLAGALSAVYLVRPSLAWLAAAVVASALALLWILVAEKTLGRSRRRVLEPARARRALDSE
ncbi:MAG: TRAP transporter permease [Candidatus Rokuibacteriota bacterium]